MMDRLLNSRKQSGEKELEVWYQIRRTEEESMERGTMETALLHEHRVWTARDVRSVEGLRRSVAQSTSATELCFPWRSGDEVADGGHIVVPSIGQVITSSTSAAVSSAREMSGKRHIVPIT